MAETAQTGGFAWGVSILRVLAVPLYLLVVGGAGGARRSDAAGNGMSQAFGIIATVLLWMIVAVMLFVARKHGAIPGWAKACLFVLLPASAIGVAVAIGIYSERGGWLIAIPVLTPLVVLAYATWARFPSLHSLVAAEPANAIVVAVLVLATAAPFVSVWL